MQHAYGIFLLLFLLLLLLLLMMRLWLLMLLLLLDKYDYLTTTSSSFRDVIEGRIAMLPMHSFQGRVFLLLAFCKQHASLQQLLSHMETLA